MQDTTKASLLQIERRINVRAGAFEECCDAYGCVRTRVGETEGGGHSVANVKRIELKKPGSEPDPTPSEDVFKRGRAQRR